MENVLNKPLPSPAENMEEEILKLEKEIYPDGQESEKCDEEVNKLYKLEDWSQIFYYGKSEIIKQRFIKLVSKSEYSQFFEGLNYEYGINNKEKDIQKAFEIYKDAANNSTDILSMYKMYHIYKDEYEKFGFSKRNKILEKFYLFKSFSYLPKHSVDGYSQLMNRFNVAFEVKVNLFYEDKKMEKFTKLIEHLKKYSDYYKINTDDLLLIEPAMILEFNNYNRKKAVDLLQKLLLKDNLEAIYKLGVYIFSNDDHQSENLFELLRAKNYYKSFCDYAIFLYQKKKDSKKALEVLKTAIDNGILRANYLYYDIFLDSFDFSEKEKDEKFKEDLLFIFNLLINDIATDGIYSYFEYFYLRKLCIKHWNLKDFINSNFLPFTHDFAKILIENTSSSNSKDELDQKSKLIKSIYQREDYFSEFHLSCGIIYYYGVDNLLDVDLKKSLIKFQISFDNSDSKSYKRFCYSYISKIKQKLFEKDNNYISSTDNENSKKKLFDLYNSSVQKSKLSYLSSSFFYYLARLYGRKWGNPGDDLYEYLYFKKSSKGNVMTPGTGTSISYYRRYKSFQRIEKNKEKYISKLKEIKGYGEDAVCCICYKNENDTIFLPCRHLFCKLCSEMIEKNKPECPLCRAFILTSFYLGDIKNT